MKYILKIAGMILLGIVACGVGIFLYFNASGPAPREDVALGMTFSSRYAESLGLNWQETYLALLDDIGIRKMRLPVYWDLIEKEPGKYSWDDLDWQVQEVAKRNGNIILVVGQRVPRWPECHIPTWANGNDSTRQLALLKFIEKAVERYKNNTAISMWQVENEPFLIYFGVCPKFDVEFLDQEIALVKRIDATRPVLLTDSGELSLWYGAAKRGDVFGTTLYRHIWSPKMGGYFTYPIGPNFFRTKEFFVRALTQQEHLIIIELQAEPWASGWVADVSLTEQFRTMDENKLRENVEYAKRVGFPEIYLWGGEWWYWMKVKKDYPALWETGKELFSMPNAK